jgi:prevent-host-death family protein
MDIIGMYEARTHFSEYIRATMAGKEFVITNRGEEVAMLSPIQRRHNHDAVKASLDRLAALRSGSIKNEGESWNDFARDGQKW